MLESHPVHRRRRRTRPNLPPRQLGSWSDLPIRIGQLSWSQWWRATIYTVLVLVPVIGAIVMILLGGGKDVSYLLGVIRSL